MILLLLDLLAAFHTVDHQTLLDRLSHRFGVNCAFKWFGSHLSDRYQTGKVNGGVSSSRELHHGVPRVVSLDLSYSCSIPDPWVM